MNIYLIAILAILVGSNILDIVADLINLRAMDPVLPGEFRGVYEAERYRRSQEYLRDTTRLAIVTDSVMTSLVIGFILAGGFNIVDRFARGFGLGPIFTGLIFAATLVLLSRLVRIPFSAYGTFVIEQRYGFNRTTAPTFVKDILKRWGLGAVIGGGLFAAIVWLFMHAAAMAWLYCWAVTAVAQVFVVFIAPAVILPLFNVFTLLPEGELRNSIERYAVSQRFKMRGIYTMDASRRSSKSNAFFTGFGRFRRIVLFDTLVGKYTTDELVSVLAHEIGHWKRRHVLISLLMSIGASGIIFALLPFFMGNRGLFDAFGIERISVYAGIFLFAFLFIPVQEAFSIMFNAVSRRQEYEADRYAARTYGKPEAMAAALKKLSADNLSNLTPHPFKVLLDYSHPPILERIKALRNPMG